MRRVQVSVTGILADLEKRAAQGTATPTEKTASAGGLLGSLTAEDLLAMADRVEARGELTGAAEQIVDMQKAASAEGAPAQKTAFGAYLEMRKIAHRRACERLGIQKVAGATNADRLVLTVLFGGGDGPENLAKLAAEYTKALLNPAGRRGGRQ